MSQTAQMKKSVIIKCRQQEANNLTSNGTFNTVLKNPILLEEGDIVNIKTAIIDASADSLIIVPEETAVAIEMGKYYWNTDIDSSQRYITNPAGPPTRVVLEPVSGQPPYPGPVDNQIYILGHGTTAAAGNVIFIESITVFPIHKNGVHDMGGLTLNFEYNEMGGLRRKLLYSRFMKLAIQQNHPKGLVIDIGIYSQDGLFDLKLGGVNLADYRISNITVQRETVPVPAVTNFIVPRITGLEFIIQPGRYTPAEIAAIINDNLSLNNTTAATANDYGNDKWPVDSPILTTIAQDRFELSTTPNTAGQFFIRAVEGGGGLETVDSALTFTGTDGVIGNTSDAWLGANEMSLNYDSNLNKLNFDIMHFPWYVTNPGGGSAIPGVTFVRGSPSLAYSGVYITALEPAEFWQKQLGFTTIPTRWTQQKTSFLNNGQPTFPFNMKPIIGENITAAFNGVDLMVTHTDAFYRIPPGPNPETPSVATSLTSPIISDRQFDKSPNDEGYYLVEIGFKFPQMMIAGANGAPGAQNNNRVQSIVGKYYTSGNFLQDTGAGSIAYEHRGEAQLLTDLQISIRHPNGSIPSATEIGPDNSIFIEIVKELQTAAPNPQ